MGTTQIGVRPVMLVVIVGVCAACSTPQPVTAPARPQSSNPSLIGVASWYGPGFEGHRTAGGAVYNQEGLTAASTVFPIGTRLHVTNLDNRRAVDVAINDHGPYVKGREIDLSRGAAHQLRMVRSGTAPVRMEVLSTPPGGPPIGQRYFVQVGSFRNAANARRLARRLAASYRDVRVTPVATAGDRRYRVRLGAYLDRRQAERRAAGLARLGYYAKIVTE